jgi:hypothetical protein
VNNEIGTFQDFSRLLWTFPDLLHTRLISSSIIIMQTSSKRELMLGLQYLLIGFIAEGVVLTWFNGRPALQKMLIWLAAAVVLGVLRLVVLGLGGLYRRSHWGTISKRYWI